MNLQDRNVHVGDIASYENASDDFLKKRKEDLQEEIRHPHLTAGEYARKVLASMSLAIIATGWTAWWGIERIIDSNKKLIKKWAEKVPFVDHLFTLPVYKRENGKVVLDANGRKIKTGERIRFLYDEDTYRSGLESINRDWAEWHFAGTRQTAPEAKEIAKRILDKSEEQNFTTGYERLRKFKDKKLPTINEPDETFLRERLTRQTRAEMTPESTGLKGTALDSEIEKAVDKAIEETKANSESQLFKNAVEKSRRNALHKELQEIRAEAPHAHIAKYADLFDRMREKVELIEKDNRGEVSSGVNLAVRTFEEKGKTIVDEALQDNARMIRQVRLPATGALVAAAGLLTLAANSKNARKQKALEQESELTHIERLQRERHHAAQQIPTTSISN